ncbi:hypothetical protein [Phaeobacter sp.]|uniref:hypothetical protein n=1 Tax=Phaeobacter sp. TaxID=1902409 RepID=UPI0025FE5694|nr:hypothetical protein [Phaeobacter sp.]
MDLEQETYPGGFFKLMRDLERKEATFLDPLSALPKSTVNLAALWAPVADVDRSPDTDALPPRHIDHKWQALQHEFTGQPQLWALHALVIAILRRRTPPPEARHLFLRIWQEQGDALADQLPIRWLVSAAATFADHGDTIEQRLGGQGLHMLFQLMQLHDSERRLSGRANDNGFPRVRGKKLDDLGFGQKPYNLPHGDLDKQMLARLWRMSETDEVFRPLGQHLLRFVMADQRSIFGRIQRYKKHSHR